MITIPTVFKVALMILKIATIAGMVLVALGTIMLWRSSPSGYALGGYGGGSVLHDNALANQRRQRGQRVAIGMIILGTVLQVPAVLVS